MRKREEKQREEVEGRKEGKTAIKKEGSKGGRKDSN